MMPSWGAEYYFRKIKKDTIEKDMRWADGKMKDKVRNKTFNFIPDVDTPHSSFAAREASTCL